MDKQNKLDNLKREIVEFKNYSEKLRESMIDVMGDNYHPLPFFGNANAKYMFIGVAPGRLDKKYKNPSEDDSAFKYGSGKILMRLLKDFNIDLELIFFTNIIKSNTTYMSRGALNISPSSKRYLGSTLDSNNTYT